MKHSYLGFGVTLGAALLAVLLIAGIAYAGTYHWSETTDDQHDLTLFAGTLVDAQASGAPSCYADTVLRVDGPGSFYIFDENSGGACATNSHLNFTVPTTGVYTFEVADWNGRGMPFTLDITTTVPDSDSDGLTDDVDNCPSTPNPGQADGDGDGQGDVCDLDNDNDGVNDVADNCPLIANADQANADGDGQGDVCDTDDDNDGVLDGADNCVLVANPDQADSDGNGIGDVCDGDLDGDGVLNGADNCPLVANADQRDSDGDGIGDACDGTPLLPWIGWDPGDGRLNPDAAAPAAVYLQDDRLGVYWIDAAGDGSEVWSMAVDEIAARCAPPPPAEHTLIASAEEGAVRLYCLNTGEIQLNVFGGPVEVAYVWDVLPGWHYQITYAFDTATLERLSLHIDFPK